MKKIYLIVKSLPDSACDIYDIYTDWKTVSTMCDVLNHNAGRKEYHIDTRELTFQS